MEFEIFGQDFLGPVTAVTLDGQIWFLANDVCKILKYSNPTMALKRFVKEDNIVLKYKDVSSPLRERLWKGRDVSNKRFINETGLYKLVTGSRLAEAELFSDWIHREVIPSLRKDGGYIVGQEDLDDGEQKALRKIIRGLRTKVVELEKQKSLKDDRLRATKEKLKAANQRWHASVDAKKEYAYKYSKSQKELKTFKQDSEYFFKEYNKLLEENKRLLEENSSLREKMRFYPSEFEMKKNSDKYYTVNKDGFVHFG